MEASQATRREEPCVADPSCHSPLRNPPWLQKGLRLHRRFLSQRHGHSHEAELVCVLSGELVLVEEGAETLLCSGDCAAFPSASGHGHHLQNRGMVEAVDLEVGSRHPDDLTTCSDIDWMSSNPYPYPSP
jgi:mannose-6-phosphate isomerase-like protein (cupin superfamily)